MQPRTTIFQIITNLILLTSFCHNAIANRDNFFELTKSRRSETLGDIYTFGLYAPLAGNAKTRLYTGMQIFQLEKNNFGENDSTVAVFVGQSIGTIITPFYEIGTDLYGFLTLLNNDNQTHTCTSEYECTIDFFFRIGLRMQLGDNLTLGIFHENIDFGVFHENLSGEHRYVGSSLGLKF